MRNRFLKLLLLTLSVLALAACSNDKNTAGVNSADDTYSFAFLTNTQNNTFQTAMNDTFKRLANEKGYKYTMLDPDYDLNKQINQMTDAANQGFDAVFVIPVDSAGIRQGLEAMKDNQIPVFNVDTAVIEEDRDLVKSIIATDAYMAGQLMGQQMVKDYPDGAKIAILDFPSNESCVLRVEGFLNGLGSDAAKFEIVAQQDGKASLDASLPIAEDIIQAHSDLDAFFAINDPSALGVAAAIAASNRDDIGVYSIDASPDGKEALLDGSFTAVAAQVPIQIAETSFHLAVDYLEGKDIEQEILLPSHAVTKEMAEETAGNWQ
ncbi:sugar ABC transporter substrate-binding protein [Paenibacillus fonticola]|uniref:sugar ABC transporter substrate-binding protein n=1 Tax=Paenibacillus fonticola TaxID=379896 RepID=UPI0003743C28|nr:sugar ABC transporter substrate-binding protein [Paenibacillus fonticola]